MSKEFYRGEIFYIRNESEYSGNVQGGGRPAVIISNDLVKKWAEAANEAVKPDEKEPEPIAEKVEMPDVETQLEIAKITAERDVYKRLYEEAMARR